MASDFQSFVELVGRHLQDRLYRDEVEAEVLDHLELAAADLEATGLSPEEARRQAEAAFGDPALIGRLLRNTPTGGDPFMKLTRLGGLCGILAGLYRGLLMFAYVFERNHPDPASTSFPLRIAALVILLINVIPFPLFLLTFAGTYPHLPGSRVQKRFLIAVQMAGVITALWGVGIHNSAAFLSGFFVTNVGTVLAGILLAVRKRKSERIMGAAMVVAGLGLLPFKTYVFTLGNALGYTIGMLTAMAWMLIGFTLLSAGTDQPNAPVQGAN